MRHAYIPIRETIAGEEKKNGWRLSYTVYPLLPLPSLFFIENNDQQANVKGAAQRPKVHGLMYIFFLFFYVIQSGQTFVAIFFFNKAPFIHI